MGFIKFCPDCTNMLYPKEDRINKVLLYACKNCEYQEETFDCCVYRNAVCEQTSRPVTRLADMYYDPTLPKTNSVSCPNCSSSYTAYFRVREKKYEDAFLFSFVCGKCKHVWIDTEGKQ